VLGRSGNSQSLSLSTLFWLKITLFLPNNTETGSYLTAHATIQSYQTADFQAESK
jgi:hypothetical protein